MAVIAGPAASRPTGVTRDPRPSTATARDETFWRGFPDLAQGAASRCPAGDQHQQCRAGEGVEAAALGALGTARRVQFARTAHVLKDKADMVASS